MECKWKPACCSELECGNGRATVTYYLCWQCADSRCVIWAIYPLRCKNKEMTNKYAAGARCFPLAPPCQNLFFFFFLLSPPPWPLTLNKPHLHQRLHKSAPSTCPASCFIHHRLGDSQNGAFRFSAVVLLLICSSPLFSSQDYSVLQAAHYNGQNRNGLLMLSLTDGPSSCAERVWASSCVIGSSSVHPVLRAGRGITPVCRER